MDDPVGEVYVLPPEVEYLPVPHTCEQRDYHNRAYFMIADREQAGYILILKEPGAGVLDPELLYLRSGVLAAEEFPVDGPVEYRAEDVVMAVCCGGGGALPDAVEIFNDVQSRDLVQRLVVKESL